MTASSTGSPLINPILAGNLTVSGISQATASTSSQCWSTQGGVAACGYGPGTVIPISSGGTGATTAAAAAANLVNGNPIAPSTVTSSFVGSGSGLTALPTNTSLYPTLNQNTTGTAANITGVAAIINGGTGATTAAQALTNLGALPLAGGTMTGALNLDVPLAAASGGTGGATQTAAFANIVAPGGTMTGPVLFNTPSVISGFLTDNYGTEAVQAWGNSQTQGYGLPGCTTLTCHPTTAWPAVFTSKMGWTLDNQAYGSSDCADLSYQGTSESMWDGQITSGTKSIYGHFRNDQSQYANVTNGQEYVRGCIEAEVAWLAIPEGSGNKFRANGGNAGTTGTWTYGNPNSATGYATTSGATMTFTVYGPNVFIAVARQYLSTSTYTITVDGTSVIDPISGTTTFSQSLPCPSVSGGNCNPGFPVNENIMPYLVLLKGLSNTVHDIVYTCTTLDTAHPCLVFYAAASQLDNATADGPTVYELSPIRNASSNQAGNMADAYTSEFFGLWEQIVNDLRGAGLQVVPVDALNPIVYNADSESQADGIHPNTTGHAAIAADAVQKATYTDAGLGKGAVLPPNLSAGGGALWIGAKPSGVVSGAFGASALFDSDLVGTNCVQGSINGRLQPSTTPCPTINGMQVYNNGITTPVSSPHVEIGLVPLNTSGTALVTFGASYTAHYSCGLTPYSGSTPKEANISNSQMTITGTASDQIFYVCIGY